MTEQLMATMPANDGDAHYGFHGITPDARFPSPQRRAMMEIAKERNLQIDKWGAEQSHSPAEWMLILMEEMGELAEAILKHGGDTEDMLTRQGKDELRQVAAVAIAWLEDRNRKDIKRVIAREQAEQEAAGE